MIKLFVGCTLERIYLRLKERKCIMLRFIKVDIHVFVLQVNLISQDPVFLGYSKYQRLHIERLDLVFITLLLRLTIAQAWTTSCTSEQRGEFASVQGPGPTEGADRKEQRKMDRENDGG